MTPNATALEWAGKDPVMVADFACASDDLRGWLAEWPPVGVPPGMLADDDGKTWAALPAAEMRAQLQQADEEWEQAGEAQTPAWRALMLKDLLLQRRRPDFMARMRERGLSNYEDDDNARGIVEHLAKMPQAPDSTGGLSMLATLARAWQAWKEQETEPDRRRRGILPAALRTARQNTLFDTLPERLDGVTPLGALRGEPAQGFLPTLEPPKSSIIPVLPIAMFTAAGGKLSTPGHGAPIAQRLFFELLMTVNRQERNMTRRPNVRLRDLVNWIWPKGWQRGRDLPRLQQALVEVDNMRIHFDRRLWRLIAVNPLPAHDADLDDLFGIHLEHLPASDRGPLIDRYNLRLFGLQSAPAWRSFLRMAYLWDAAKARNGGFRIHATRPAVKRGRGGVILDAEEKPVLKRGGEPVTDWSDVRAVLLYNAQGKPIVERNPQADKVPMLDLDDLARLGFDDKTDKSNRRRRTQLTRDALTSMERQGAVVLEKNGEGWRVLEPAPPGADLPERLR